MVDKGAQFGTRLREIREAAGMTQLQVCEKSGLTMDGLSKLERGLRKPSWETVLALAGALGVTCESFTLAPTTTEEPKRGRPRKEAGQEEPPERPKRGRPKKKGGEK